MYTVKPTELYSPVVNQQKSDLLVDCLDIGMEWQNICEMATISGYVHLTRTQTLCIVLVREDWNVQEWPSRRSQPLAHRGKFPVSCELVLGHSYPVFPHPKK